MTGTAVLMGSPTAAGVFLVVVAVAVAVVVWFLRHADRAPRQPPPPPPQTSGSRMVDWNRAATLLATPTIGWSPPAAANCSAKSSASAEKGPGVPTVPLAAVTLAAARAAGTTAAARSGSSSGSSGARAPRRALAWRAIVFKLEMIGVCGFLGIVGEGTADGAGLGSVRFGFLFLGRELQCLHAHRGARMWISKIRQDGWPAVCD
jgi:hypothetical protein